MADLEALAGDLHARGMSLCVDLVLNHTAAEHPWARAAAGDPAYRAFYRVFADRELPDRYERTLPEVFPDQAPGSFTQVEGMGWVWTTFNGYQWDLDWSNPEVFAGCSPWCSTSPTAASTSCAWTPRRSCGSARGPTARTSRRCT